MTGRDGDIRDIRPGLRAHPMVREEVSRALAEALPEARRQARDELVSVLRQAIVDTALAELGSVLAEAPGPESADNPSDGGHGLYVYAITRADENLELSGVDGVGTRTQPRIITHDGLGVVVSEIELAELAELSAEEPTEDSRLAVLARRHDEVVRAAFERNTVLPMRFGTVLSDADAAVRMLTEHHDQAVDLLDRIAGSREWGVKVRIDRSARHEPKVASAEPGWRDGEPPSGTEYLAHRRAVVAEAEEQDRQVRIALDDAHDAIAAYAVDSVHRRESAADVLMDVAYLVTRERTEAFLAEAERSTGELAERGLRVDITGPWPPYSFARADFPEVG